VPDPRSVLGGGRSTLDRPPPRRPAPAPAPVDAAKRSRWKWTVAVVVAVVVVAAVVALVVKGKMDKPVYKPGQPVPAGQVVSLGTVTVALADGHLAQVTIALQMTEPANLGQESDDAAHLQDVAVTAIGQQTYTALLAPGGRTAVQEQILTSAQQILGTADGAEQVSAVYFTGFVLQ